MCKVAGTVLVYRLWYMYMCTGTCVQAIVQVHVYRFWYKNRCTGSGKGTGVQGLVQLQVYKLGYR